MYKSTKKKRKFQTPFLTFKTVEYFSTPFKIFKTEGWKDTGQGGGATVSKSTNVAVKYTSRITTQRLQGRTDDTQHRGHQRPN